MTAVAMLFEIYPEEIVDKVSDPVRGLPSKNTFLPAIAEIRKALDVEMVWLDAVVRRQQERERTAKVLEPHTPAEGEAERVKAGFAAFQEETAAWKGDMRRPKPPPDARFARSPEEVEMATRHWDDRLEKLKAEYSVNKINISSSAGGNSPNNSASTPPEWRGTQAQPEG